MTHVKKDASSLLSDSISIFTKSATQAFDVFQNQVRNSIARAETDARQAQIQRDEALKALQDSTNESQRLKDHILELKAQINHHVENYALLQRETNQWKDQAKNWQEHFLRVEEERCSLSSRVDELVSKRQISPLPKKSTILLATHSGASQPPTYHSAVPTSSAQDANFAQSPTLSRNSRSTAKSVKRKVPNQSELPPYTEVVQRTKVRTSTIDHPNRSPAQVTVQPAATSRSKKVALPPAVSASSNTITSKEPRQIFIRRVRAVFEVKREEESNEDLDKPVLPESPEETVTTPRRSHKTKRARQIIDDDDDYVPDNVSHLEFDKDAEDDELRIEAGDDLSFDIDLPPSLHLSTSKTPNKKRKQDMSSSTKRNVRRKT